MSKYSTWDLLQFSNDVPIAIGVRGTGGTGNTIGNTQGLHVAYCEGEM